MHGLQLKRASLMRKAGLGRRRPTAEAPEPREWRSAQGYVSADIVASREQ